jgi:DNA-binding transcriptional regulator YhcF (GntR family)
VNSLFDRLVFNDQQPVYLQIIAFIKQAVAAGELRQDTEIPSRRNLAAQLGINPMTVQKAYKIMEDEGLIRTQPNARSIICVTERQRQAVHDELIRSEVAQFVRQARTLHLEFKDVVDLISKLWDQKD